MTAHACTTFDPTCWRCDLSKDEVDCPTCNGSGVLVDCHGGSCSHVNDREYPCPACETAREVGDEPEEGL